jgi:hypothetical protein
MKTIFTCTFEVHYEDSLRFGLGVDIISTVEIQNFKGVCNEDEMQLYLCTFSYLKYERPVKRVHMYCTCIVCRRSLLFGQCMKAFLYTLEVLKFKKPLLYRR